MNKFKEIFKYIVTFFILIAIFNLLLYLVSLIPSEAIEKNVYKSSRILNKSDTLLHRGFFAFVDNSIDGLVINESYSIDSEDPLESYMLIRKNYKKGQTKIELGDIYGNLKTYAENNIKSNGQVVIDREYNTALELARFLEGEVEISQSYSRYYHGYLVLIRPLLLLFSINGIRLLMSIVFIVLFGVFVYLLYKKLGLKNTIIFSAILIIYGYFAVGQSLQSGPMFIAIMISLIILLLNLNNITKKSFMYFLFIVGMIACYVDFLTTPVLSLFIPLAIVYTYNNMNGNTLGFKGKDLKEDIINIFILGIVWSLGYALTWFSKAILVNCMFNEEEMGSFIKQIAFRISGEVMDLKVKIISSILFTLTMILETICIMFILLRLVFKYKPTKIQKKLIENNYNLLLAGLIPFAWMILLMNHTLIHFGLYSYRNLLGPVLAFYLIRYGDIGDEPVSEVENQVVKNKLKEKT